MKQLITISSLLLLFNTTSPNITNQDVHHYNPKYMDALLKVNNAVTNNKGLTWSDNLPILSPLSLDSLSRISDMFGYRAKHPILGVPSFHFGIDFAAPIGSGVYSTANGIVKEASDQHFGYGKLIIIDHGDGYETRYAHLNSISVKTGDYVNANDKIGEVGSTGMSTGPHLHYEIRFNNKPIDPLTLYFNEPATGEEYIETLVSLAEGNDSNNNQNS
jgi:murein DD-endopeptidase MepM/ murein hydrolase activator NlpD